MRGYTLLPAAIDHLDAIYSYTASTWGEKQASVYMQDLFDLVGRIASGNVVRMAIPAEFEVNGYFLHHQHHYVYWREPDGGPLEVAAVLHERMHQQMDHMRDLEP